MKYPFVNFDCCPSGSGPLSRRWYIISLSIIGRIGRILTTTLNVVSHNYMVDGREKLKIICCSFEFELNYKVSISGKWNFFVFMNKFGVSFGLFLKNFLFQIKKRSVTSIGWKKSHTVVMVKGTVEQWITSTANLYSISIPIIKHLIVLLTPSSLLRW